MDGKIKSILEYFNAFNCIVNEYFYIPYYIPDYWKYKTPSILNEIVNSMFVIFILKSYRPKVLMFQFVNLLIPFPSFITEYKVPGTACKVASVTSYVTLRIVFDEI